jgi:DNA-binding NarL/FixJ family response regulator
VSFDQRLATGIAQLPLPPRQRQVVSLLFQGRNRYEIGEELGVSHHTVRDYVRHIYIKLDVQNSTQLLRRTLGAPAKHET